MTTIHPTADVESGAELGADVVIGPGAFVDKNVKIGDRTEVGHGVVITGQTSIGCDNRIFPYAVIGTEPQDIHSTGKNARVEIGDRNTFREYVTVNLGTDKGEAVTRVGNDSFIMAYCHIAHDCVIGDHVIMANAVNLAGHVHVEDYAGLSGLLGVHHFVTIGTMAVVGGMSRIVRDVPPYMLVEGNPARVRAVNVVGLGRNGLSAERIDALKLAHRLLFRSAMNSEEVFRMLEERHLTEETARLIQSVRNIEGGRQGRSLEAFRKDNPPPKRPAPPKDDEDRKD